MNAVERELTNCMIAKAKQNNPVVFIFFIGQGHYAQQECHYM
jgi:hypothetical protein